MDRQPPKPAFVLTSAMRDMRYGFILILTVKGEECLSIFSSWKVMAVALAMVLVGMFVGGIAVTSVMFRLLKKPNTVPESVPLLCDID